MSSLIIQRNQITPDTFRSFVFYIICERSRRVDELGKRLGVTGRRRKDWQAVFRTRDTASFGGDGHSFLYIRGCRIMVCQRRREVCILDGGFRDGCCSGLRGQSI